MAGVQQADNDDDENCVPETRQSVATSGVEQRANMTIKAEMGWIWFF